MSTPTQLRQYFRQRRRALSTAEQHQASDAILRHCIEHKLLTNVSRLALYFSNDGEPDCGPLLRYCQQHQIETYVPVLHPFTPGHLIFCRYQPGDRLVANRFGIGEPQATVSGLCPLEELDMIMLPLVAFDRQGNRLGMGGGFYDRTLAPLRQTNLPVKLIGIAHNCQQAEQLPTQHWDIPLPQVLTPAGLICAQQQQKNTN